MIFFYNIKLFDCLRFPGDYGSHFAAIKHLYQCKRDYIVHLVFILPFAKKVHCHRFDTLCSKFPDGYSSFLVDYKNMKVCYNI